MRRDSGPPNEVGPRDTTPEGPDTTNTPAAIKDQHRQSNGKAADHLGIDEAMVAGVDGSIWQALFDGHFRLAVRCDTCGRWLTANDSKRAQRGPRCQTKAVGQ
ncbi:hypothetical protein [Mycobacterium sp.]|uniref:hypothetical protein n=1 Tax=Mycobacterium sp. TaxID=1785 RepID=UPI003F9E75C8